MPGGPSPEPSAQQTIALFDPAAVYGALGYVTGSGQVPFVGNVRLLAGPAADTALVVVALSMQNRNLAFRRTAAGFGAAYRVELTFRQGDAVVQQARRDEQVVVDSPADTRGAEASITYQGFIAVPTGRYRLSIVVRDLNGPGSGRYEGPFGVPRLNGPAIAAPLPVYRATPRADRSATPDVAVNPSSTVDYGTDSLRFYVETYGLPASSELAMAVVDSADRAVWAATAQLHSAAALRPLLFAIAPSRLAPGRYELKVGLAGGGVVAHAPFLVAMSGRWIVADYGEMMSLLRYFTSADTLERLARAPAEDRAAAWRGFWRATDPDPATAENEALDRYLTRLAAANELYGEEGTAGWLTDRGEAFIRLGTPDRIVDPRPGYRGRGRLIEWIYGSGHLVLRFVDQAGFGRLRLEPASRTALERVVRTR